MSVQAWVTLIVGVVGFGGVIVTLWQKDRADRRAELWRRLTWAFEQTVRDDVSANGLGLAALGIVSRSALVSREEKTIASVFLEVSLARSATYGDILDDVGDDDEKGGGRHGEA